MTDQQQTLLLVTVDTEEDNWGQHRSDITCRNINVIPRLQELFDRYNVLPTYLVTYQVCLQDWAVKILADIQREGRCEIGGHLHPWNTPPQSEILSSENSFLKNLDYSLQIEKLQNLTEKISEVFALRPTSFRTGRWGLGKATVDALLECGYTVDSSVTPTLSWRDPGNGPVFSSVETDPYILSGKNSSRKNGNGIFEVPATIGYNRWPFDFWDKIYAVAEKDVFKPFHLLGILNRTSILRKIWLSPEGFSAKRLISLVDILLRHDKRILNFSFHSNTLLPGLSPFTKTEQDVEDFFAKLSRVFEHLNRVTKLRPVTLSRVREEISHSKK